MFSVATGDCSHVAVAAAGRLLADCSQLTEATISEDIKFGSQSA